MAYEQVLVRVKFQVHPEIQHFSLLWYLVLYKHLPIYSTLEW